MPKKGVTFEIKGLAKVVAGLNKAFKSIEKYSTEALEAVALDLLSEAVKQAPVDTGDLRGSGRVRFNGAVIARANKSGGIIFYKKRKKAVENYAVISFSTPYAAYQHEVTGLKHPRGGNAKYLERPLRANSSKYFNMLKKGVQKGLNDV